MDGRGYLPRRFMDDSVYRSAPYSPSIYSMDPRSPRYLADPLDNIGRGDYFGSDAMRDPYGHPEYRPRSPFESGLYVHGGGSPGYGIEELVRRTNLQVAVANGSIHTPSSNAQIHPMMTPDGRYPSGFRLPIRLQELVECHPITLDRILMAYDLDVRGRSRLNLGRRDSGLLGDDLGYDGAYSKMETAAKLVTLLEYLGAHRLVAQMERTMQSVSRGLGRTNRMIGRG